MKVSVALCTYNGAGHLPAQLRSIRAQTRLPDELVVSDDGSSDETSAIIEAFGREAPFPVRFHRQGVNLGVTQNFAFALGICRGEFIALCDQDDVWVPRKLEAALGCLERSPHVQVIFSDATLVDDDTRPLPHTLWQAVGLGRREHARLRAGHGLELLFSRTLVTGAAVVMRATFREWLLPIPPGLPTDILHDGWLALLAAARGELATLPAPLFLYRQHPQQQVGVAVQRPARGPWRRLRDGWAVRHRRATERSAVVEAALHRAVTLRGLLHARLGGDGGWLKTWDQGIAHLQARREMPVALPTRLRAVAAETWTGRYARFESQPAAALFRDMAYPPAVGR